MKLKSFKEQINLIKDKVTFRNTMQQLPREPLQKYDKAQNVL